MQEITKAFIYKSLNTLDQQGINVTPYRAMLVGATEVPYEVIVFINRHTPIEKLSTYNEIHNKRRNSPLFRNLMKTDLPTCEKAIVLSSLLTQSLIGLKHCSNEQSVADALNADMIMQSLRSYIYEQDEASVETAFSTFQVMFKTLFPK